MTHSLTLTCTTQCIRSLGDLKIMLYWRLSFLTMRDIYSSSDRCNFLTWFSLQCASFTLMLSVVLVPSVLKVWSFLLKIVLRNITNYCITFASQMYFSETQLKHKLYGNVTVSVGYRVDIACCGNVGLRVIHWAPDPYKLCPRALDIVDINR